VGGGGRVKPGGSLKGDRSKNLDGSQSRDIAITGSRTGSD